MASRCAFCILAHVRQIIYLTHHEFVVALTLAVKGYVLCCEAKPYSLSLWPELPGYTIHCPVSCSVSVPLLFACHTARFGAPDPARFVIDACVQAKVYPRPVPAREPPTGTEANLKSRFGKFAAHKTLKRAMPCLACCLLSCCGIALTQLAREEKIA